MHGNQPRNGASAVFLADGGYLYDAQGRALAYIDDDGAIFTRENDAVAFIADERVYSWMGRHIGWWCDGILHDDHGRRVGFTSGSNPAVTTSRRVDGPRLPGQVQGDQHGQIARPALSASCWGTDLLGFLDQGGAESRNPGTDGHLALPDPSEPGRE